MSGPYGDTADRYWAAGWRGIFPLKPRTKKPPPDGYTGEHGVDPSYADVHAWATGREAAGNIGLRMPRHVIGIDVDNYGDKVGGITLAEAEERWGALPETWRSTSRDDGTSGIRFYRVPEGLAWPGEIKPDIELIQHRHRYAVVAPSIHPDTGSTYRWINPAGVISTVLPDPDALPLLPDAWVEGLTRGEMATSTARNSLDDQKAALWLATRDKPVTEPCTRMQRVVEQLHADLTTGSAHCAGRDAALRAARLADEHHTGAVTALMRMKAAFTAELTRPERALLGKRHLTAREADREWNDIVTSGVNLVTANPSDVDTCDCDGRLTAAIVGQVDGNLALAPNQASGAATQPEVATERPRMRDGATFILDVPAEPPAVWGFGDEVLWAEGEALMIVGPPGVGKTTLCGQVLRARLGLDQSVLGLGVKPTGRRVLYMAMDRPAQIARALRRVFTEADRDILRERLRVWEGPPPGDVAKNPGIFVALAQLADADTVVVDSLKDAAVGLSEDEVAAGYNRARQNALTAGIQMLELHHMVKRGTNGSKPNTLADVYGSTWLTSGAGSVLLLWGQAGDPLVEAVHLKQPAAEVGPFQLVHDHTTGRTDIQHAVDLVAVVRHHGRHGCTPQQAAHAMFQKDEPSKNDIEKARRKLDKLVDDGVLERQEGTKGGKKGGLPSRYFLVGRAITLDHDSGKAAGQAITHVSAPNTDHGDPEAITRQDKTAGQAITRPITPITPETDHARTPLYRGGGALAGEIAAVELCPHDNTRDGTCVDCGEILG
ncbi:MAG: bifunctional DNA primase/polymerase [Candidatus Nanopelagicales bacterium]